MRELKLQKRDKRVSRRKEASGIDLKFVNLRIFIIVLFFGATFLTSIYRAYTLQIQGDRRLDNLVKNQYFKRNNSYILRGSIFDRNNNLIALSNEVDSFFINPKIFNPNETELASIAAALNLTKDEIKEARNRKGYFAWLKRKVDPAIAEKLKVQDIRGFYIRKETKRYYPNNQLFSNILGFSGLDSTGLSGLELKYNDFLMSQDEEKFSEKDARGNKIFGDLENIKNLRSGNDLTLTLDKNLQFICEDELSKVMKEQEAKLGICAAMDPMNGELLAAAVSPGFDPNRFNEYPPENLKERLFSYVFEPGSTFKMLTIAAAFREGVLKYDDLIYCENGEYKVGNKVIHDTTKKGWLSVEEIIKHSSNIGAVKIGERIGKNFFYNFLDELGFGKKGNQFFPGESKGLLRPVKSWKPLDLAVISFGQGIGVTPVQLLTAFSSLINGGKKVSPVLLKDEKSPESVQILPLIHSNKIKRLLSKAIGEGSTGTEAKIDIVSAGGKTGTSQKFDKATGKYSTEKYIASFIGFAPVENPRISVLILVDEPKKSIFGGSVAAPVFKNVIKRIFSQWGYNLFSKTEINTDEPKHIDKPDPSPKKRITIREALADHSGYKLIFKKSEKQGIEINQNNGGNNKKELKVFVNYN